MLEKTAKTDDAPIRLVDLRSDEKEAQLEAILDRFRESFRSSSFILGEPVKELEERFAKLAGCRHGIGLNSGTDAILLALRALGIGAGDEVITVSNSFVASVSAIVLAGARPVLVDVGWDYNIDPDRAEAAITPRTKAILPVHLTGYPCRMDRLEELATRNGLLLIEDAAQAIGATHGGRRVGSFGKLGCFSLHPLKNLHVWGDGGMATTNDDELARLMRMARNHGQRNRDEVEFFSYNSRLDTLQAIVGLASADLLDDTTAKRRRNAAIYDERLDDLEPHVVRPLRDDPAASHVYHLYVVRAEDRDRLQSYLAQNGVETKVHYPIPVHLQKAASGLGYGAGDLPVTERLAGEILSLPIRENLEPVQIERVCDLVRKFYLA